MRMRTKGNKLTIFIAALLVCVLGSCTREIVAEYGYVSVSVSTDVHIEDAATKSEQLPEASYPEYNIALYKEGEQLWKTKYDVFLSDVQFNRIPAGTYTIEVESCTEAEAEAGNGRMRLLGSEQITVVAGRTAQADILCQMANARVTLAIDPVFAAELSNTGASVTDGKRKISLEVVDTDHVLDRAVYYNVGTDGTKDLLFTVTTGIISLDKVKAFDVPVCAEGGKWNKVTLKNL